MQSDGRECCAHCGGIVGPRPDDGTTCVCHYAVVQAAMARVKRDDDDDDEQANIERGRD